jgi:hypothetical protein
VWETVDGDLVERRLEGEAAASSVIPYFWVGVTTAQGPTLRLAEDAAGERLAPTPEERASTAEAELERVRAELAALRGR